MRSERRRLLGGNLLTSLSITLGVSPYTLESCVRGLLTVAQCNEELHRVFPEHPPRVITKNYHSPSITLVYIASGVL